MSANEAGEQALQRSGGIDALPGATDEGWAKSPLGAPARWTETLRGFAAFITTLPHPAAIFWGDELVLLHNDAWKETANGAAKQGAKYKDQLVDEALSMVRTAMLGKTRQSLRAEMFINNEAQDGVQYQALLSPLMVEGKSVASGVMVQLYAMSPKQEQQKEEQQSVLNRVQDALSGIGSKLGGNSGLLGKGKSALDSLPLDENPFFQRFAAMLPTGMAILNHKAEAVFVNEQFFELTTAEGQAFRAWPESIHPDDYDKVMTAYQECFKGPGKQLRIEFRTIGQDEKWRLLILAPLGDSRMRDESIEKYGGFVCAVIDITPNKAQELAQKRAAQEALERKEQQERFIDMISHEIRNPLSAVLHCAEEILEIVGPRGDVTAEPSEANMSALTESAETIKLCVAHQKNIVDDILSFSKLDASMLSLSPKSVQPRLQLADSLKMFQPEIKKQHMELDYMIDTSYEDTGVNWVKADLVRISQILVNLITNAIKFTAKKDGQKKITVMVGSSFERPTSYPPNVVFFDSDDLGFRMDGTNSSEWGNGQALYIMVAVKDTGIGISADNQKKLFQRFRQATPKTEESYGGSGLGLMISRKLCQLHGGEIGVSSIENVGSTFGFFFKVRKVENSQRPSQKERISSQEIMKHMHRITKGEAPIEDVADEDIQENLKHPEVKYSTEAGPSTTGSKKWEHTSKIASDVTEVVADEYGQKSRNPRPRLGRSVSSTGPERKIPTTLEKMQRRTDSDRDKSKTSSDGPAASNEGQTHVLLVEDNVINQRILKRKLEGKHFKVTTANNGREAVDAVMEQSSTSENQEPLFDVILMDQEMPVLDGNAATREIRSLEHDCEAVRTPILGVTANVREQQKNDMVNAGMDEVISKPYSMEDLVGKIEGLVVRERSEGMSAAAKKEVDDG